MTPDDGHCALNFLSISLKTSVSFPLAFDSYPLGYRIEHFESAEVWLLDNSFTIWKQARFSSIQAIVLPSFVYLNRMGAVVLNVCSPSPVLRLPSSLPKYPGAHRSRKAAFYHGKR